MTFYLVVLTTILAHTSFKGSKVLMSLFAIELGANPFAIGTMFAVYSIFPVFLSLHAGKISDRLGFRLPMLMGSSGLLSGLVLPFLLPSLAGLYASAVLIGIFYIFYTVSVQHLIGAMAEGTARTRNYGLFSLGIALTSLLGPTTAGFAIDLIGHRATYALLAAFSAVPVLMLTFRAGWLPQPQAHPERGAGQHWLDLARSGPLRRALLIAGILETGQELFNFFLPIYARSIGFSASEIGLVMGSFATALMLVRSAIPLLVRRSSEERVLSLSLFLATAVCLAFPLVTSFAFLLVMAFALGLGLGGGAPLSLTLAYNRAPPGRSGEAIGLRQSANKTIEVVMPLVFGSIGTLFGAAPVFWLDALLLAWGALLMRKDARAASRSPG